MTAAELAPPAVDGVLAWKDPPPPTGPGHPPIFGDAILGQLRRHPARWALIRTWPYRKTIKDIKPPPRDIETCMVTVRGRSELYARATSGEPNGTH